MSELRADHLLPRDQFRRGHRLYEADRVAVTIDDVVVTAHLLHAGSQAAPAVDFKMHATEIVRTQGGLP